MWPHGPRNDHSDTIASHGKNARTVRASPVKDEVANSGATMSHQGLAGRG